MKDYRDLSSKKASEALSIGLHPNILQGKTIPHSVEAERALLAVLMHDAKAMIDVLAIGLIPQDFYVASHQVIFQGLQILFKKDCPLDTVALVSLLKDRGEYEQVGLEALVQLFESYAALDSSVHYAKIIKHKALLRSLIRVCSQTTSEAIAGVEDLDLFLDHVEKQIFELTEFQLSDSVQELRSVVTRNIEEVMDALKQKRDASGLLGLPSGFSQLDAMTSGFQPGQLIIIAARPGMGKTSWIVSLLNHMMAAQKVIVLFTLEMSSQEMGFRFVSARTGIPTKRLRLGNITPDEASRLPKVGELFRKADLYLDDQAAPTVLDIRSRCRRVAMLKHKIDLIVVDYLQLMRGTTGGGDRSREREISEISRGLKNLAKDLKVPIIALSQLNRGVESRPNKRPLLSDLRESGALEQDADIVGFIYRDQVYHPDTKDVDIGELILAKHRAGELGTVRMRWVPSVSMFVDLPNTPENYGGRPL